MWYNMTKNKDSNYDESNLIILSSKGHTRFIVRFASCMDYVLTVDKLYSAVWY